MTLAKPTIMLLVPFTGATSLVMEGSKLSRPVDFLLVLVALYLTGGCANALNQYFERDIDAHMSRTSRRRPLPQSRLTPMQALTLSVTIGVLGVFIFAFWFNLVVVVLLGGLFLKRLQEVRREKNDRSLRRLFGIFNTVPVRYILGCRYRLIGLAMPADGKRKLGGLC